jgi:DNA-binding beta-propeller fold protein YncE
MRHHGQDPLFVVDTQTGQRIAEVPGLAVGNAVLLSNDGKKAYVSRANFKYFDPASKNFGAPLSIIDTASNRIIKTFILQVSTAGLALTPDGKYLLATNGFQLSVIDTQTDELVTNLSLRGFGSNIVVRSDNTVFVEVPDRRRIVQFQLDKALAHWPCESVGRSGF